MGMGWRWDGDRMGTGWGWGWDGDRSLSLCSVGTSGMRMLLPIMNRNQSLDGWSKDWGKSTLTLIPIQGVRGNEGFLAHRASWCPTATWGSRLITGCFRFMKSLYKPWDFLRVRLWWIGRLKSGLKEMNFSLLAPDSMSQQVKRHL